MSDPELNCSNKNYYTKIINSTACSTVNIIGTDNTSNGLRDVPNVIFKNRRQRRKEKR